MSPPYMLKLHPCPHQKRTWLQNCLQRNTTLAKYIWEPRAYSAPRSQSSLRTTKNTEEQNGETMWFWLLRKDWDVNLVYLYTRTTFLLRLYAHIVSLGVQLGPKTRLKSQGVQQKSKFKRRKKWNQLNQSMRNPKEDQGTGIHRASRVSWIQRGRSMDTGMTQGLHRGKTGCKTDELTKTDKTEHKT